MPKIRISKEDKAFSKFIRNRDGWRCQRCGGEYTPPTKALHCSHYWRRGKHSTRFDEDNAIALCYGCHMRLEGDKQGEYKDLMIKKLGKERFNRLEERSKQVKKARIAEQEAWEWLKEV